MGMGHFTRIGPPDPRSPHTLGRLPFPRAPHAPSDGWRSRALPAPMADHPSVKVHDYGKDPRPGRKVGHVTATGDDLDEATYRARAGAAFFEG